MNLKTITLQIPQILGNMKLDTIYVLILGIIINELKHTYIYFIKLVIIFLVQRYFLTVSRES